MGNGFSRNSDETDRVVQKISMASLALENAVNLSQELPEMNEELNKLIGQIESHMTLERGLGALRMAGSASKIIGALMMMAKNIHPSAYWLWNLGTGLKVLDSTGNLILGVDKKIFMNSLSRFLRAVEKLTRNLIELEDMLNEIRHLLGNLPEAFTLERVNSFWGDFYHEHKRCYDQHILKMIFDNEFYQSLFDLFGHAIESSDVAMIVKDVGSGFYKVPEDASRSSKAFHCTIIVGHELYDFMDGYKKFTNQDENVLKEYLTDFVEHSSRIMSAISLLRGMAA